LTVVFGGGARPTTPGLEDTNLVLPTVLMQQLPTALGALGLAAVFSAEVSTCDALLFMLATSLSKDLYKRFLKPEATDAGAAGGILFALWLPTVTDALRIFYSLLGVTLLVPVVGGLYTKAGSQAALASIVAGIVTLLAVRFGAGARLPALDPTLAGLVAAGLAYALFARAPRLDRVP
jgi:SSS family solute:Na+ symporter